MAAPLPRDEHLRGEPQLDEHLWWQPAVIYQIYPRSFLDTTGNGVGDLQGIRARLDHLRWLGVDAVWLSPIYRSPMADFGYDVADYRDVDPLFGSLADVDALIADAHERGLRVLLDWVPNHTSHQHPWFLESRSSRDNPKRDWYFWRDQPNNWVAAFSDDPAWTYDEHTGQYYLHHFLPQQPDLNWANPEVREAMHDVLRFWLDRGVDGFRADVVHMIGKDQSLPDDPAERIGTSGVGWREHPSTHDLLRGIRSVLEDYGADRLLLGEINLTDTARIASYHGQGDELHLAFNFIPLYAPWDAATWRDIIDEIGRVYEDVDAWPCWVLENHDQRRLVTRLGSRERARAAAVLLTSLRGTTVVYAGQELGLADAEVPPERVVDPGGRDGCRAPLPWEPEPPHGWATADPWLPWPPEPATNNVASERDDDASFLHLYRTLLRRRRESPALRSGRQSLLNTPDGVLGFDRVAVDDERRVLVNFTDAAIDVPLDGQWDVEVDSTRPASSVSGPYRGRMQAAQALLLRRPG